MIGGIDVFIERRRSLDKNGTEAVVEFLKQHWPSMILTDSMGQRIRPGTDVRFYNEIFVYQDEKSFDSWEMLGADPSNEGTMVQVIPQPEGLSLVIDDENEPVMRALLDHLRGTL